MVKSLWKIAVRLFFWLKHQTKHNWLSCHPEPMDIQDLLKHIENPSLMMLLSSLCRKDCAGNSSTRCLSPKRPRARTTMEQTCSAIHKAAVYVICDSIRHTTFILSQMPKLSQVQFFTHYSYWNLFSFPSKTNFNSMLPSSFTVQLRNSVVHRLSSLLYLAFCLRSQKLKQYFRSDKAIVCHANFHFFFILTVATILNRSQYLVSKCFLKFSLRMPFLIPKFLFFLKMHV